MSERPNDPASTPPPPAGLDVPPEHRRGLPEVIVSPFAGESEAGAVAGLLKFADKWRRAMRDTAAAVAPVLEPGERVIAASPALRSPPTWALVVSVGFAGAVGVRRHFIAITDRRVLLLRHSGAVRVADAFAEIELLSFAGSMVRRDPTIVLRFRDARGKEHRLQFVPMMRAEAEQVAGLLRAAGRAPGADARVGGAP